MNPLMKLICLALVASALAQTTSGFAITIRSVKHCIPVEGATDDTCTKTCRAQSSVKNWNYPLRVELDSTGDGKKQCCCKYDDYWNMDEKDNWFDEMKIEDCFMRKLYDKPKKCHSLIITSASKEEKKAHNTMCKYLKSKRPLTMLELSEFIGSVSYLRSIEPKSGRVRSTLNQDYVPNFTTDMHKMFEQNLEALMDYQRDPKKPGPPFEVDQIEKLTELTTTLRKALDTDIVHRALDEYLITRVMFSVLGGQNFYNEINRTIPGKSFESLRGNHGLEQAQDPRTVQVADFSCEKFINARDALGRLMKTSFSALKSLKIEGTFGTMMSSWTPLYELIRSIVVYNRLIEARCPASNPVESANSELSGDEKSVEE